MGSRKKRTTPLPRHPGEPVVGLGARPAQVRRAVQVERLQPVAIRVEDGLESGLEAARSVQARADPQYAASLRMASAIFSGLTMNQSSRAWL